MESISRLSAVLENARDLTLEASRDATSLVRRSASTNNLSSQQLKKLLDSRNEREVLDGLRRVIQLSQNQNHADPPLLFSQVVKNIASPAPAIKKLVYIYLLANAEREPDTALLAVNTIQKTLSAPDPYLRALALRVMSGLRVPVIAQIVSLAIKKGCVDMSPVVRKAAALAIPKCWRLEPSTALQLTEYLSVLLGDRQYFVAGAAVIAFMQCCPERLDLIHKHYRHLARKLVDMDEWSQLATLKLMCVYGRSCFPRKTRVDRKGETQTHESDPIRQVAHRKEIFGEDNSAGANTFAEVIVRDPDLTLLLNSSLPLLQSRNSAVIIAVARLFAFLDPPIAKSTYLLQAIGPLISLLRSAPDIEQMALYTTIQVMLEDPSLFVNHTKQFLLRARDSPTIAHLKLEALTLLFPYCHKHLQSLVLTEFAHFTASHEPSLREASVRALGRCSQGGPKNGRMARHCQQLLLGLLHSSEPAVVAEALTVIRHMIQAEPGRNERTVVHLAKRLDTTRNSTARASIIWLVGEFSGIAGGNNIAADVLRLLVKGFSDESEAVKLQIVQLAAKVLLHHLHEKQTSANGNDGDNATQLQSQNKVGEDSISPEAGSNADSLNGHNPTFETKPSNPTERLYSYVHQLVRYDTRYDLRDLARVHRAVLSPDLSFSNMDIQFATLLLLSPKPIPTMASPSLVKGGNLHGSTNSILSSDHMRSMDFSSASLPSWVEVGQEPDPRLRNESDSDWGHNAKTSKERITSSFNPGGKSEPAEPPAAEKTLDDWLAEDSENVVATAADPSDTDDEESEFESSDNTDSHEVESDEDEDDE